MEYELPLEDIEFFDANGYVVLHGLFTEEELDGTVEEIFDFVEFDLNDIDSFYSQSIRARSGIDSRGMVPFYHGQHLWNNRQNQKLYTAFRTLIGRDDLFVSIDRVNINPPRRPGWEYGGFVHFDVDTTKKPVPVELQGILGLSEFRPLGGGFRCLPGFHKLIDQWAANRRPGADPRFPDPGEFELVEVPLGRGDFLIFDGRLPHGNSENLSDTIRVAQYITMWPIRDGVDDGAKRAACIATKSPPATRAGRELPPSPKKENAFARLHLTELGLSLNNIRA